MKSIVVALASGVSVVSGASAQAAMPSQFDLACHVVNHVDAGIGYPVDVNLDLHFRVDAVKHVYCIDECRHVFHTSLVTPQMILFSSYGDVDNSDRLARLDVPTSEYTSRSADGKSLEKGTCTAQAFSGIPGVGSSLF